MGTLDQLLNTDGSSLSVLQLLAAFALSYAGGLLASLTPCVYPMIPITLSVVGGIGSEKKRSWHEIWARSLAYVSGMTMVYSFLGVLAGITGRVFGTLTNTPGWYLFLGVTFTIAALSMMDVIPFDPAMWWASFKRRFKKGAHPTPAQQKEMTLLGAFVLGASSGFIAAPCTTPVLTSILAFVAKTQSVGLGLSLMFFFSIGLGTLLLGVAIFAGSLQKLPRSGVWMVRIKTGSGLILLALAGYLIYRAGQLGGI